MDSELIYTIVGVAVFGVISLFVYSKEIKRVVNPPKAKRDEIIDGYKKELYKELASLKNDKELRMAKKSELLKKFSDELSLNIFFEKVEIREILLDLSKSS